METAYVQCQHTKNENQQTASLATMYDLLFA